jgi:hypothetical protein
MNLVFTICSKNYLAQARVLCNSLQQYNAQTEFLIVIADKLTVQEKLSLFGYKYLLLDDMHLPETEALIEKYNVIELNTCLKPFIINYLFQSNANLNKIIYLDPDIYVFASLQSVFNDLDSYDFILTPHFITPIFDDLLLSEKIVLNTGIFNLGFLALRRGNTIGNLLNWWSRKLMNECFYNLDKGYFVDQLWMNLSICHFENYKIDKNPGLNAAHWNLHERLFSFTNGAWWVNNQFPLVFFHFSTYSPKQTLQIAKWQNRYTFSSRPDIVPLFTLYAKRLEENQYDYYSALTPAYGLPIKSSNKNLLSRILSRLSK